MKKKGNDMYQGMSSEVIGHRSKHDMTMIENVRFGTRMVAARVVVVPDRRLIDDLEERGLWGAFKAIDKAVKIRTHGLGMPSFDLSAARGKGMGGVDNDGELLAHFDQWVMHCRQKHFSPLMVLDLIVDGLSLRQIDAKRKLASGTAKKNLINCLEIW